jgi:hypothetical protein
MNSFGETLLPAGIVLAIGGAVAWVLWTEPPLAHAVAALDHSLSVRQDCAKFRQATEALVHEKAGIRKGSTLALMVMGREPGVPNAVLTFAGPLPMPPEEVYGRNIEDYEQTKRAFFDEIENACAALEPARHSPIYRLVKQGIAQLRSLVE